MRKQIDYQAIEYNFKWLEDKYQKSIIAVLKNNGYNTDLLLTAKSLKQAGCNLLMVTNVEEAVRIKQVLPDQRILIATVLTETDFKLIADYEFELMVESSQYIIEYYEYLKEHNWHLKLNCGMNRFGFDEGSSLVEIANTYSSNITGLYAHMPLEDEDEELYNKQVDSFITVYNNLQFKPEFVHLENSATLRKEDTRLDVCNYGRIGIMLYGYGQEQLKPSISLDATVVKIRDYQQDSNFSYGLNNKVQSNTRLATIDIGYGDGIIDSRRELPFYINDKAYYQLGKQSMSHTYISVDDSIKVGDKVEVYGNNISIYDHAMLIGYPCSKIMSYLN